MDAAVAVQPQLRARRLRPSAHAAAGLRLRTAVRAEQRESGRAGRQELADQRHRVVAVGHAVHHRRRQRPAAAAGRLADDQRRRAIPRPGFGEAGPDEPWYDPSAFSQPGNAWGNSGRNAFRGPANWNLDFSLFRAIPFGRYRVGVPRRVAERVQPRAVGQPGDRASPTRTSCASARWPVHRARCSSACASRSSSSNHHGSDRGSRCCPGPFHVRLAFNTPSQPRSALAGSVRTTRRTGK